MSFLSKIFSFLKKWWWLILVILIVIFVFFPVAWAALASAFSSLWASIGPLMTSLGAKIKAFGLLKSLAVGFGLLAVVSPETAKDVVKNVGEVASSVVDTTTSIVGGALKKPLVWVLGGLGLWLLLSNDSTNPSVQYAEEPK